MKYFDSEATLINLDQIGLTTISGSWFKALFSSLYLALFRCKLQANMVLCRITWFHTLAWYSGYADNVSVLVMSSAKIY